MTQVTEVSSNKCFGGYQKVFSHQSKELSCEMNFAVFLPASSDDQQKFPVLYWVSFVINSSSESAIQLIR